MKKSELLFLVAAFVFYGAVVGCDGNKAKTASAPVHEETEKTEQPETYLTAIDDYLVEEIGTHYSEGDVCIPYYTIVNVDETNPEDVLVWGDFWVFNYNVSGDTLKTVSGGSHPGLFHLAKLNDSFVVSSFDVVEDGSGNLESAKKIFADNYEEFQKINSDDKARMNVRRIAIKNYVREHDIPVTMYQDYGNKPVDFNVEDTQDENADSLVME
jgi:hypothetical protein